MPTSLGNHTYLYHDENGNIEEFDSYEEAFKFATEDPDEAQTFGIYKLCTEGTPEVSVIVTVYENH